MQARARLLHAWTAQVRALAPTVRATRATALAHLALGILWAGDVTLLKVAAALPLGACDPSTERRLRRWLANPDVVVAEIWPALLRGLLAGYGGGDRRFVFDPTPHRDRTTLLVVGLVDRGRALPVAWRVVPQQAAWEEPMPDLLGAMLAEVNAALPPGSRPTLLCDRGLVGPGIVDACVAAGWDVVLRLRAGAGDATRVRLPDGTETSVAALAAARVPGPGAGPKHRWHGPVDLFKAAGWRAGALTVSWPSGEGEPWVLFSTRDGGLARVRDYRRRTDAEATYQDSKRRGFDLERSRLTDRARVDRLLLALHLAVWWGQQLGPRVIRTGQRRRFDRADRRDLSVARLGRRLFAAALDAGRCPPLPFHRSSSGLRYTWLG